MATSGKMNILTGEVSASSRGKDDYIGLFKSAVLSETETNMDIFVFPYYKDITRTTIVAVSSPYVNVIAVKAGNENNPAVKALVEALKSDKVKAFIEEKYAGSVIPLF